MSTDQIEILGTDEKTATAIVRMPIPVAAGLLGLASVLCCAAAAVAIAAVAPPAEVQHPPSRPARRRKPASRKPERLVDPSRRKKTCAACRKSFLDDSKTNTRKTCSDACRRAHELAGRRGAVGPKGPRAQGSGSPAPRVGADRVRAALRRIDEDGGGLPRDPSGRTQKIMGDGP